MLRVHMSADLLCSQLWWFKYSGTLESLQHSRKLILWLTSITLALNINDISELHPMCLINFWCNCRLKVSWKMCMKYLWSCKKRKGVIYSNLYIYIYSNTKCFTVTSLCKCFKELLINKNSKISYYITSHV